MGHDLPRQEQSRLGYLGKAVKMRDFLVYTSCDTGQFKAEFLHPCRTFDLAINNYLGTDFDCRGEYSFREANQKWRNIQAVMGEICDEYRAVAFIDDDIQIEHSAIDQCFRVGLALELDIWQPSLTADSYASWPHTLHQRGRIGRFVPFVEIMMPFFSHDALYSCWHTFSENESGWGIEFLWPKRLLNPRLAVLDCFQAKHCRPIGSKLRKMPNGKTSLEECHELAKKHNLRGKQYGRFNQDLFKCAPLTNSSVSIAEKQPG